MKIMNIFPSFQMSRKPSAHNKRYIRAQAIVCQAFELALDARQIEEKTYVEIVSGKTSKFKLLLIETQIHSLLQNLANEEICF